MSFEVLDDGLVLDRLSIKYLTAYGVNLLGH